MPQFCHYTDDDGAERIIRSGKIMASLQSNGDAASGNGVYLTQLNPNNPGSLTRAQVAQNNWLSKSDDSLNKTKNFFVLEIPDKKVKNVSNDTRNIFVLGGRKDLPLVKYKWFLQDFDTGKIISSHKYRIGSTGPATANFFRGGLMGDYVMTEKTVNGCPVYKKTWININIDKYIWKPIFLFMTRRGKWFVGPNTDKDEGWLSQKDKYSLGPGVAGAWKYLVNDADSKCWKEDDATLKAYPWYKYSPWRTVHHSDSRIDPVSATTASATAATSTTPAAPAATTAFTTATTAGSPATITALTTATTATSPAAPSATTAFTTATTASSPGTSSATSASTTSPAITTTAPGITSISVKALVHTTPAPATNAPTSSVVSTSSNVPDPDNDKGLQSPGTTPSGRVYGGPPGKTTGLGSRFAAMFFLFVLLLLFVFGFWYYPF